MRNRAASVGRAVSRSVRCLAWLVSSFLAASSAIGHPLQAEPINHAHVFTFDQFNIPEDPDEHVVDGGHLLLAELSCTACHAAPDSWRERLRPKPGPNLAGVGSRLDEDTLWLMIRSPQHRKRGTQMPGLFAGEDGDDEKVEALVEFLAASKAALAPMPPGDAERGKGLYHKAGCVACHEPAADVRPPKAAADVEVEKPGLGSVPIALADAYDLNALARFLRDPLAMRPSGRMPDMRLTDQEAADIAAYLHVGRVAEKATARAALNTPRQGVERGRAVFAQMNCIACHGGMMPENSLPARKAPDLASLNADRGCMAASQPSGTPRFDLNELQKRAIRLALDVIKRQSAPVLTAQQQVDWHMSRLNCYACHDRDGKGGPEDPRAQYFTVNDAGAESLGELAHLPPSLDKAGRKLAQGWFEKVLWGADGGVRPYMDVRMPAFGRAQTEPMIRWLQAADKPDKPVKIDVSGLEKHHRAELGRQLIGAKGLACVACHGLKDRKSLGPPVIRLTHTVERLQPEYFKELLLNPQATQTGTVMPPMFVGRKKADQEIESLWIYLKELEGQPLPEGLISTEDFELKPEKAGRPVVFRSFIEGAGSHAIGVGFPQGVHAAFDAVKCQWTLVWRGRFLDAMSNWQSRDMLPIKPLGADLKTLQGEAAGGRFLGYRLGKDGVPTMRYERAGKVIEDTLRPAKDGRSFEREITMDRMKTKEVLSW